MILLCHNCGAEKNVQDPPKEFVCLNCGAVNVVPRETSGIEPLGCLAPTGFEWTLPSGVTMDALGKDIYITAQGSKMTREEYLSAFGIDPKIAWEQMRKLGKEGREGFVNLSTLGKKKRRKVYEISDGN